MIPLLAALVTAAAREALHNRYARRPFNQAQRVALVSWFQSDDAEALRELAEDV